MKKIAIVCGSPSSEFLAPFEDESWEIWVLGNRLDRFKDRRVTRVFEIHDDIEKEGGTKYADWLVAQNIPLVVGEKFPTAGKNIEVFPYMEAKELIGHTYLTSSSAYMMAKAILEGATHIGVYGVDMAIDDHEYFWQRPCMDGWIHFARGRGIEVIIPEVSNVGKCDYVEGLGKGGKPNFSNPPFTQAEFLNIAAMHETQLIKYQNQIKELEFAINGHDAAKQVYERLAKIARAIEAGVKVELLTDSILIK